MPHAATVAGEACPPEEPPKFLMTLQKQYRFSTVPVLMQSASKTEEIDLQSYLLQVRGKVQQVPLARCGEAKSQGAIRAYYRLPAMDAKASGQTEPLGLKISFGLGTRVLKVPDSSHQAYATACMTVAGGNLREFRLSHLPAFPKFLDHNLLPKIHGLVIWVLGDLAPARYSFSDSEIHTGEVPAGCYDFIGFVAAFFRVSPVDAYERMFPKDSAGKVSFDMRYLYFR